MLADDFTGAGDVGLMFEKAGIAAEITIAGSARPPQRPGGKTRAWIIDTESRSLPPRKAASRVRAAMRALKAWKADRFYKKIDSTLRGNLASESTEFLRTLPGQNGRPLAFVPGFPNAGRTVRDGILYVAGRPLAKTPFARDPRHSVRSSSIAKLVGPLTPRLWIPDVKTQADLRRVAEILAARGNIAAIGAAGLAEGLATIWGGRIKTAWSEKRGTLSNSHEPVLVVVGSLHPQSRRQLLCLIKNMGRFRKSGPVFIVQSPGDRVSPSQATAGLVRQADFLMRKFRIRRFVVTGGETAAALCGLWNLRRWKIESSLDTGVPLCRPIGKRRAADWRMVVKPGGFGKVDIFVKAVQYVA